MKQPNKGFLKFYGSLGLLSAAGILCASCALIEPRELVLQNHFIWEARSDKSVVYLLGTIPVASEEFYPLPPIMEGVFEESDTLVVERDTVTKSKHKISATFARAAVYPRNEALSGHLNEAAYQLLVRKAKRLGIPYESLERFRPWFVADIIHDVEMNQMKFAPGMEIDRHFLEKAGEEKQILELEEVREQVQYLNSLTKDEQEEILLAVFGKLDLLRSSYGQMLMAWSWGDGDAMDSLFTGTGRGGSESGDVFRRVTRNRSQRMAQKVDGYLKEEGSYFVVVPVEHLVGKEGILQILRDKEYPIRQL